MNGSVNAHSETIKLLTVFHLFQLVHNLNVCVSGRLHHLIEADEFPLRNSAVAIRVYLSEKLGDLRLLSE